MDPNAALKNVREAVGELRQQDDDGVLDGTSQVGFLLESFEALDEWLTKGGFLPDEWAKQDEHPVPLCDRCGGTWGEDMMCPRCTKIVGALVDEAEIVAEVPGGFIIARDLNDPGPLED